MKGNAFLPPKRRQLAESEGVLYPSFMQQENVRVTPLDAMHRSAGATMTIFAGHALPMYFSGIRQEHLAVRSAAGLFDVSHMGQFLVEGSGACAFLDWLLTANIATLAPGRGRYALLCQEEDGGIIDDLIVYCMSESKYWVVCNAANAAEVAMHLTKGQLNLRSAASVQASSDNKDGHAHIAELSSPQTQAFPAHAVTVQVLAGSRALLALQGPKALDVLARALPAERHARIAAGPAFSVCAFDDPSSASDAAHSASLWVARTGYTGEDGVELSLPSHEAPELWNALLDHGAALGLQPCGLGARDTLRLEAGLRLHGSDMHKGTQPLHVGLERFVAWEKPAFSGRNAMLALRETGPVRRLVGIAMEERGIARAGHRIFAGPEEHAPCLGEVTSGAPGISVPTGVAMAFVHTPAPAIGASLWVDIRGKRVRAKRVSMPFYRRQG